MAKQMHYRLFLFYFSLQRVRRKHRLRRRHTVSGPVGLRSQTSQATSTVSCVHPIKAIYLSIRLICVVVICRGYL